MGLFHGGMRFGHTTLAGSGRWGWLMGVCHWDTRHWNGEMALIYGDALWGRATWSGRWDWFAVAHHGGATLAGSGRWDWCMGTHHGGARHWLDRGDGIDSWERAEWQSTIWLLNSNDDTMCPYVWRWGKCAECVWLGVGRCKLMGWCVRGGDPSVGWRGCAPHVLNHQWVRVGGVLCVR